MYDGLEVLTQTRFIHCCVVALVKHISVLVKLVVNESEIAVVRGCATAIPQNFYCFCGLESVSVGGKAQVGTGVNWFDTHGSSLLSWGCSTKRDLIILQASFYLSYPSVSAIQGLGYPRPVLLGYSSPGLSN